MATSKMLQRCQTNAPTHTHARTGASTLTNTSKSTLIHSNANTHTLTRQRDNDKRESRCVSERERKKDEMPSGAKSCEAVCNFACDNCLYPQSLYIKIVTETCISLTLSRSYTLSLSILHTQARTHILSRSFTPASLDIFLNYPAVSFAW